MPATPFKDWIINTAPPWLRTAEGEAFLNAIGDLYDEHLYREKEGIKARLMNTLYATADSIRAAGGERNLYQGPTETIGDYAIRIRDAWAGWTWAGTAYGVLKALSDSGYSMAVLYINKGKKYSLTAGALTIVDIGFEFTFNTHGWNRFLVYFPTMPASWSGTPPVSGSDEANFIIDLVKLWKPAHAAFEKVVVFGTAPTWGFSTWGGTTWSTATVTVWLTGE